MPFGEIFSVALWHVISGSRFEEKVTFVEKSVSRGESGSSLVGWLWCGSVLHGMRVRVERGPGSVTKATLECA